MVDDYLAKTLAEFDVTDLQHMDAKMCVRLRIFDATIVLDVRQSVVEPYLLASSSVIAQAVLDDIVHQIDNFGVAKATPKLCGHEAAGEERYYRCCQLRRLA